MEIDHVFASGAVVGRATTHSWGRPERRATPLVRGGASNHGSWRKNVVNSYNHTLLKAIRIANIQTTDYKREVEKLSFEYRTTSQTTTGVSPAELMFGRKLRTKLPSIHELKERDDLPISNPVVSPDTRAPETDAQNKAYRDQKVGARELDIHPGERVLLRKQRQSKLKPTYEPSPYEVIQKKGNAVIIRGDDGLEKMRNAAHVKKYVEFPDKFTYVLRETEVSEQTPERVTVTPTLSEPISNHVPEQALESSDPSVDTEPSVVTETPIYDKPKRVKKKSSYLRDYIT